MGAKQTTGTQKNKSRGRISRNSASNNLLSGIFTAGIMAGECSRKISFWQVIVMLKIKVNRRRGDMDKPGIFSLPAACARVWVTLTLASQNAVLSPQGEDFAAQCQTASQPSIRRAQSSSVSSVKSRATNCAPAFVRLLPTSQFRPVATTDSPDCNKYCTAFRPRPLVAPVTRIFTVKAPCQPALVPLPCQSTLQVYPL